MKSLNAIAMFCAGLSMIANQKNFLPQGYFITQRMSNISSFFIRFKEATQLDLAEDVQLVMHVYAINVEFKHAH
jgi:hypothetical protein